MYHTVVSHLTLRQRTQGNHLARFWWFEPVRWMEKNVKPGPLPHEYNWPIPARAAKLARKRLRACFGGGGRGKGGGGGGSSRKVGRLSKRPGVAAAELASAQADAKAASALS